MSDIEQAGQQDKSYYSHAVNYLNHEGIEGFRRHIGEVKQYVAAVGSRLKAHDETHGGLKILELGAGTCLNSLLIRKLLDRGHFICMDISAERMSTLVKGVAKLVGSSPDGFEFVEGDFSLPLPFPAESFDLVLFDASLHHSRDIWMTLREVKRILRRDGAVAALREASLARLTYDYALKRMLNSPEVKAGVTENAYLRAQYEYYFRACGFEPEFIPVFCNWKWKLLAPLNGWLISKYDIWATH